MRPYFELAAAVNDVFEEDDAMLAEKRQMGMGRLYRAWKGWRAQVDGDFDTKRDELAKKEAITRAPS